MALSCVDGVFGAIHGSCNHAGGPLGQGTLEGDYVVCPWHQWRFHRDRGPRRARLRAGRGAGLSRARARRPRPGERDAAREAPSHAARAASAGARAGARARARARGRHLDHGDERATTRASPPPTSCSTWRSRTPRELGCGTQRIRLRELSFRHCEGYYSKSARACTWPCSITQMDPEDQLDRVYEALVHWADVFVIATPIRWGGAEQPLLQDDRAHELHPEPAHDRGPHAAPEQGADGDHHRRAGQRPGASRGRCSASSPSSAATSRSTPTSRTRAAGAPRTWSATSRWCSAARSCARRRARWSSAASSSRSACSRPRPRAPTPRRPQGPAPAQRRGCAGRARGGRARGNQSAPSLTAGRLERERAVRLDRGSEEGAQQALLRRRLAGGDDLAAAQRRAESSLRVIHSPAASGGSAAPRGRRPVVHVQVRLVDRRVARREARADGAQRRGRRCPGSSAISVAMSKWCGQHCTGPAPRVRPARPRSAASALRVPARELRQTRVAREPPAARERMLGKLEAGVGQGPARARRGWLPGSPREVQRYASASVRPASASSAREAPSGPSRHKRRSARRRPTRQAHGAPGSASSRQSRERRRPSSCWCGSCRPRARKRSRRRPRSPAPPSAPAPARRAARAAPPFREAPRP